MIPAVHRLSEGRGLCVVTVRCRALELILTCFLATHHQLDGKRAGEMTYRESLPHKEEALIKPSWEREVL